MSFGHPDFADVRRHFFGIELEHFSGVLNAGQVIVKNYAAADCGDCVVVAGFVDPFTAVDVFARDPSGSTGVNESGMATSQSDGVWMPINPMGGGVSVNISDPEAAAGKAFNIRVLAYTGIMASDMYAPAQWVWSSNNALGAGGALVLPFSGLKLYDTVSFSVKGTQQSAAVIRYAYRDLFGVTPVALIGETLANAAANQSVHGTVDLTGQGSDLALVNTGGVASNVRITARAYKKHVQ